MNGLNLPRGERGRRGPLTRLEQMLRRTRELVRDAWSEERRMQEQLKELRSRVDAIESCAVADGLPPWAQGAPVGLARARHGEAPPRR